MSSPSLRMASSGGMMDPLAGGGWRASRGLLNITAAAAGSALAARRAFTAGHTRRMAGGEAWIRHDNAKRAQAGQEPKRPPATSQGLMGRRVHERSMDGLPAAVMRVSTTTGDRDQVERSVRGW